MNNIAVLTTSRSDYGLLENLLIKLEKSKKFNLHLIVSGTHLSKFYGNFFKDNIRDKFKNIHKIRIPINERMDDDNYSAWGVFFHKYSILLSKFNVGYLILLGDRIETLLAAIVSHCKNIPIAHIGGGELTSGAIDNAFRHSISKMSNLHFVSEYDYYKRLLQLGERKKSIFMIGDPSVELINNLKMKNKITLEKELNFKFYKKNILVTYHPETLNLKNDEKYFLILLKFLKNLEDYRVIFTFPNSDPNSNKIIKLLIKYKKSNSNFIYFKEMGSLNYLSTMQYCDFVLGNSSSGLSEAPIINIPTINFGSRQEGRIKAKSVFDSRPTLLSLNQAFSKVLNYIKKGKKKRNKTRSNFSKKLLNILEKKIDNTVMKKQFIDLNI